MPDLVTVAQIKKISHNRIVADICLDVPGYTSQYGCPSVDVFARYMVLFVVVVVTLGKGRTQNIAKAGTAV